MLRKVAYEPVWRGLFTGVGPITVADLPDWPSRRARFGARLFGGASEGVFRGMATLALGSGIGRVIGIAAIPILTRLYSPEDFGVLAVFTALVALLAPLVTLRYVLALPLPRHDGVAMNLLAVSVGLMLVLSAVVALALWLGGEALLGLVSMQVLAPWWWLIALGVVGTAAYEMLTLWATRKRAYKVIAQTNVTQSSAGAVVKIALGLASVQPLGLLVGQVVAQAGGIGRLIRGFLSDFRVNWRHISTGSMRKVAWRHRGFPFFRMPSQLLLVFSLHSPVFIVSAAFGSAISGQFGVAIMAIALPLGLLGDSVSKALYGEAAQIGVREPLRLLSLVRATQRRLFIMALIPTGVLYFFGPALFRIFFGPEWERAGQFASLLSIYLLFQFTSAPIMRMINLLDAQHMFLAINVLRAAGLIVLMSVTFLFEIDDITFVTVFATFNAAVYAVISWYVVFKLERRAIGPLS